MSLKEYRHKRKFNYTSEPRGLGVSVSHRKPRFVVHEHHASHLHWDLRLEMPERIKGGRLVLKSWAVPKGVPTKEGVKHLAVNVEDHPVEYIDFKGIIPAGQYGAGKVLIWDKGTFKLLERKSKAIKVELFGKKLKGVYVLFNFRGKNWFLFKTQE